MGRWTVVLMIVAALICTSCGGRKPAASKPAELTTAEKVRKSQSMIRAGRTQDAIEILQDALQDEPENAQLHSFLGVSLFGAGRFAEAEKSFRRALELDEYLTDARNYLGAVYNELGRPEDAERQWLAAIRDPAYPTPEKVHLNLGVLYGGQNRNSEAIEHLRRAVEIDPQYYRGHYELAGLLERSGKLEEAAREYEVAGPGYRNDGRYYYRLGFTYFRLGDRVKAREKLKRAISVAPGSPSAAEADDLLEMME